MMEQNASGISGEGTINSQQKIKDFGPKPCEHGAGLAYV